MSHTIEFGPESFLRVNVKIRDASMGSFSIDSKNTETGEESDKIQRKFRRWSLP